MRNKKPAGLQAYFQKAINKRGTSSLTYGYLETLSSRNHIKANEVVSNNKTCEVTCCWRCTKKGISFLGCLLPKLPTTNLSGESKQHINRGTLFENKTTDRYSLQRYPNHERQRGNITYRRASMTWQTKWQCVKQKQEQKRTFLEKTNKKLWSSEKT